VDFLLVAVEEEHSQPLVILALEEMAAADLVELQILMELLAPNTLAAAVEEGEDLVEQHLLEWVVMVVLES
jgi:hypothetical protein